MKVAGKVLFLAVLALLAVVAAVAQVVLYPDLFGTSTRGTTIVLSGNTPASVKAAQLVGH